LESKGLADLALWAQALADWAPSALGKLLALADRAPSALGKLLRAQTLADRAPSALGKCMRLPIGRTARSASC
jgi:hypothetical protein